MSIDVFVWGVSPPTDWTLLQAGDAEITGAASVELGAAAVEYDTSISLPSASRQRLVELSGILMGLCDGFGGQPAIPDEVSSETQLRANVTPEQLNLPSGADTSRLLDTFVRYDRFFGTRRHPGLSGRELVAQLSLSGALVLQDLSECLLDANELRSIVDALSAALQTVLPTEGVTGDLHAPKSMELNSSSDDLSTVALRRWRLGHHIFNSFVSCATLELSLCQSASTSSAVKLHLDRASRLFRGSTAAMWYAEAFPRNLYKDLIRPSMAEVSGTASGFSGADNLEFRHFKRIASTLLPSLQEKFGEPASWPDEVWMSARQFLEIRHLDVEHHTLLAEKVVGLDPSLKQLRLVERDDDGVPALSAVDSLRTFATAIITDKDSIL